MAISKLTKQVVHAQVGALKGRYLKLQADREAHVAAAQKITTQMAALKAQYDALAKDIPKPIDDEAYKNTINRELLC